MPWQKKLEEDRMPFIKQDKRNLIEKDARLCEEFGDVCFFLYRAMIEGWRKESRWRTVHKLYRDLIMDKQWAFDEFRETKFTRRDVAAALDLAWQVLFVKEIMKYENQKESENGTI